MKNWIVLLMGLMISLSCHALEEENYDDYDTIVNNISSTSADNKDLFDFNSLNLHFVFGYDNSVLNLRSDGSSPGQVSLQGLKLGMGIDLFSPEYIAEVDYSNYNPGDKDSYSYKLREFDLNVYYHRRLNSFLSARVGAGLGSRSLKIYNKSGSENYTTPVGQVFAGGEIHFGRHLGFMTELTYKNSLTGDTPEKSAINLDLGVNGHF